MQKHRREDAPDFSLRNECVILCASKDEDFWINCAQWTQARAYRHAQYKQNDIYRYVDTNQNVGYEARILAQPEACTDHLPLSIIWARPRRYWLSFNSSNSRCTCSIHDLSIRPICNIRLCRRYSAIAGCIRRFNRREGVIKVASIREPSCAGPFQPCVIALSAQTQQVRAQCMRISIARILADNSLNVLHGPIIAPIKQVEQRLCHVAFNSALRLQLLYFPASHIHNTIGTKGEIRLCQSKMYYRVIWFDLCSMRIRDSRIASLTLCKCLFPTFQVGLYVRLCFQSIILQ